MFDGACARVRLVASTVNEGAADIQLNATIKFSITIGLLGVKKLNHSQ
jgi:hypothetical protein